MGAPSLARQLVKTLAQKVADMRAGEYAFGSGHVARVQHFQDRYFANAEHDVLHLLRLGFLLAEEQTSGTVFYQQEVFVLCAVKDGRATDQESIAEAEGLDSYVDTALDLASDLARVVRLNFNLDNLAWNSMLAEIDHEVFRKGWVCCIGRVLVKFELGDEAL